MKVIIIINPILNCFVQCTIMVCIIFFPNKFQLIKRNVVRVKLKTRHWVL